MDVTLNFLFSEVYKKDSVKVIIFSRHGDKTPDNHIKDECLADIIANGMPGLIPEVNVIQHGSACVRADETVSAAAVWILKNGGKIDKHLTADSRLGSNELFAELFSEEAKQAMKENGWKNYETLVKANPEALKKFEVNIVESVNDMFAQMELGDIALSVSHSPTVETAYNYFANPKNRDEEMAIAPLDGIILVQIDNQRGTIFAHC